MRPHRVLLIEDDADYTDLLTAVLSARPGAFEIQKAAVLSSGLSMLGCFHPDIILLDLDLPDCSGYQTFLQVKSRAPQTPIIVLTGNDDEAMALKAADDGAHDYIVKGLQQPKAVERRVQMVLRRNAQPERLARSELYYG